MIVARRLALLAIILGGTVAGGAQAQERTMASVGVDHLILEARRLDRAVEAFTALTGVTPVIGGQHPGRGTQNALLSLGGGRYLELLAPITPAPGPAVAETFPLVGWALHTANIVEPVARATAAGYPMEGPTPGSRRKPDGAVLQWKSATVDGPGLGLAPFLIEWAAGTPHPSTTSPAGCTLAELVVTTPADSRLAGYLTALGYDGAVRSGTPAMRLTLDCPRGRVTFTSPP